MGKVVTLGEIMLRLSTDSGIRLAEAETFHAHYGGGEANVAISLANYGHDVTFASKVPANNLGMAVKRHLQRYGVSTEALLVGGNRLGTYYLETGVGERGASVIYDRVGSSFAQMEKLEWDLANLFKGVAVFHVSGITPALSLKWQELTIELIRYAKKAGCKISFDSNYRKKLWSQEAAGATMRKILPYVDYYSAGKLDALYLLGIAPINNQSKPEELSYYYQEIQRLFPTISVLYSTKRRVRSASANDLVGTLWMNQKYYESNCHEINPIVDRVGGGDAFTGGILHGILQQQEPQAMVDFATAASAMKHTVQGDCNPFSQQEVADFLAADSGKINR